MNDRHIGAAMPGKVLEVKVRPGQAAQKGETLLVTESMKMEYVITAKSDAAIKTVHVIPGDMVEGGDLFIELSLLG